MFNREIRLIAYGDAFEYWIDETGLVFKAVPSVEGFTQTDTLASFSFAWFHNNIKRQEGLTLTKHGEELMSDQDDFILHRNKKP